MNTRLAVLLMAGLLCTSTAHAQDKKPADQARSPQQEKMSSCSKDARDKKLSGQERKTFMKSCLGAKPVVTAEAAKKTPQQTKMATCNKEAKEKKISGPDRKAFMSTCLKG